MKDHKLLDEEDVINSFQSVSEKEFNSLMEFASKRIKEVDLMNKIEKLLGIKIDENITATRYKLINQKLEDLYHTADYVRNLT